MQETPTTQLSTKDRMLIGILGASPDAISKLKPTDRNMARRLVLSLSVPVSMMGIGSAYAATTFGAHWSVVLLTGVFCALIIFVIDSFIMASGFRQTDASKKTVLFFTRLGLSIILSLVISTPLKMAIFGDTLENERRQTKLADVETKQKELAQQNKAQLKDDPTLKQLTVKYNDAVKNKNLLLKDMQHYQSEATKYANMVSVEIQTGCKAKCEQYKLLRQDALDKLKSTEHRLNAVNTTIADINKNKTDRIHALNATAATRLKTLQTNHTLEKQDIVTQLRQLHDLAGREPIVFYASILLMLAFILLELIPMLGKSFFNFKSLKILIQEEEKQSIKTIMSSNTTMLAENMKHNANQIENLEYGTNDPVQEEIWRQMKQMVIMKNIDMMYDNMNITKDFRAEAKQTIQDVKTELETRPSNDPWMNM